MLIIFSVNDQKITHDLKGQLVAGSVDIVQAAFKFDSSWDELDKIVVFTSSACPKPVPVQFADEAFYIPKDVLKPGKLYVSVVGFGLDGRKKTTQKWDIMQAITVQKCGDGGDCDLLRYLAQGQVADGKVAKDEEVKDMLDTVFGKSEAPKPDPGGSDSNDKNVSEDDIATDKDVAEKVNGAGHLKAVPVDALPAPSEANADTIYFLRKNNSEAGKQYRAYKLIHGIFEIVGSAEVDLTNYATRESVAKADDGLIKGIYNNMTASSEKYLGSGNLLLFWTLLKSLLNGHESSINDLLARVKLLELILSADVTGNPYYVTFNTLTDVVVSSGIWNESDGRIEF